MVKVHYLQQTKSTQNYRGLFHKDKELFRKIHH